MKLPARAFLVGCLLLGPDPALAADAYEAAYERGKALAGAGELSGAIRAYREALTDKNAPRSIHLTVAELLLRQDQPEAALQEVARWRSAVPTPKQLHADKAAKIEAQARAKRPAPVPRPAPEKAVRIGTPKKEPGESRAGPPDPSTETRYRAALVRIEPGSFLMGSPASEDGRRDNETQHAVRISQAFLLGQTEVTQGQYQAVMGHNPSLNKESPHHPVERVSWFDAVAYCNKLSEKEGLTPCYRINGITVTWTGKLSCPGYRLPTEAEWEYAARGGRAGEVYSGSNDVDRVAWSDSKTHVVKGKAPNAWGLYDMSGNVWEWAWDWLAPYQSSTDPTGPERGEPRVQVSEAPQRLPDLPDQPGLAALVHQMLAKPPESRPSMKEVAERLWPLLQPRRTPHPTREKAGRPLLTGLLLGGLGAGGVALVAMPLIGAGSGGGQAVDRTQRQDLSPPALQVRKVLLKTDPPRATIYRTGDEAHPLGDSGQDGLPVEVPPDRPLDLTIKKAAYQPTKITLGPGSPPEQVIKLEEEVGQP
jgi:formylglycine-generating enzyme required for sulfatase activity